MRDMWSLVGFELLKLALPKCVCLVHCPHVAQDIVAESHDFDVSRFVPTLQEYLEVANPFKRQFLLGWLG